MKALLTFLFAITFSVQAFSKTDPDNNGNKHVYEAQRIALKLHQVYNHYKNKDIEACKEGMQQLSFELTKNIEIKVQTNATVDSLVFENNEMLRWAYYKSVDLGYIRDVEATIAIKHPKSKLILEELAQLIKSKHSVTNREEESDWETIKLSDPIGADIIDDRFKIYTVTKIASLYTYEISANGDYLMLNMKESVPKIKATINYTSSNGVANQ
ncbi:hypothetical protein [Ekhidna sp.]|uniref:hypothetical protein n=1 Tax=Ekhidna sp. TaxID=2608089 RepID=UPI003CCC11E1